MKLCLDFRVQHKIFTLFNLTFAQESRKSHVECSGERTRHVDCASSDGTAGRGLGTREAWCRRRAWGASVQRSASRGRACCDVDRAADAHVKGSDVVAGGLAYNTGGDRSMGDRQQRSGEVPSGTSARREGFTNSSRECRQASKEMMVLLPAARGRRRGTLHLLQGRRGEGEAPESQL